MIEIYLVVDKEKILTDIREGIVAVTIVRAMADAIATEDDNYAIFVEQSEL